MLSFSIKAYVVLRKGRVEKKIEEMNRGKDVKLSTSKSNGIFLFSSAWLNLSFDTCVYKVCVLEFKYSCVQI